MKPLALLVLTASALIPTIASAQSGMAEVRLDDLNLSTQAGLDALDKRIELATSAVCNGQIATGSRIASSRAEHACKDDVRQQIKSQLARKTAALARQQSATKD